MRSDSEVVNLRSVVEMLCYMVDEDSDGVEEVMQLPTIDLVRCRECKHWAKSSFTEEYFCGCLEGGIGGSPDDFCSYGERKESE